MQRIAALTSAVSVLALVGVMVLWVRSASHMEIVAIYSPGGYMQAVASDRVGLVLFTSDIPAGRETAGTVDAESEWNFTPGAIRLRNAVIGPTPPQKSWLGFSYATGPFGRPAWTYRAFIIPHWAAAILLAVPPAAWAYRRVRQRRRVRGGRCLACGYDLRASPERCPECGSVVGTDSDATVGSKTRTSPRLRARTVLAAATVAVVIAGVLSVARPSGDSAAKSTEDEDTRDVFRAHDVADLAGPLYWPTDAARPLNVYARREDDPDRDGRFGPRSYPRVIDLRGRRVDDVARLYNLLPAHEFRDAPAARTWCGRILTIGPARAQRQYAQVVDALRGTAVTHASVTLLAEDAAAADASQDVEADLERVLPEVRFDGVAFEQAVERLRATSGIRIAVDWEVVERAGALRTTPVTLHARDLSVWRALHVLLAAVGDRYVELATLIEDDRVRLTTKAVADHAGRTLRIYDVRQLVLDIRDSGGWSRVGPTWWSRDHMLERQSVTLIEPSKALQADADQILAHLHALLQDSVAPESWVSNGGYIGASCDWSGRLLIVQTSTAHREIENVLKLLHDEFGKDDSPPPTVVPSKRPATRDAR